MILHYLAGDKTSHTELGKTLAALKPGEYVIEVTRNHSIRSISANRYYFGIVLKTISIHTGHDVDELHEMFKFKFNLKVIEFKNGAKETTVGRTGTMNVSEFQQYVSRVKQWAAAFHNITFPELSDADYQTWSEIRNQYDKTFQSQW